jgi:transcriptional regulator with XRE-family HTH domain
MGTDRIKQLRKQKGLTQKEMAESVGVGVSTVAMWESGKRTPSFKLLNDLSDLFDKSIDYILGTSDDDRSPKLNDAQVEQLGTWEIQSELIDILRQYLQLDEYGKLNVRSLLNRELVRCQEQGAAERIGGLKIGIQYDGVEQ